MMLKNFDCREFRLTQIVLKNLDCPVTNQMSKKLKKKKSKVYPAVQDFNC